MKRFAFLLILIMPAIALGATLPEKSAAVAAPYVEIIIKVTPNIIIMPEGTYKTPISDIEIKSDEIKDLNRKYNLISIEKMYAKKKTAEEIAKEFPERQARAPEETAEPDLENTFLLKFPQHTEVEVLITEYKAIEGVIYIEENRTVSIF